MATERGITLTRYAETKVAIPTRGDGFRVRIVASDGVNIPNEIFIHRNNLLDPHTATYGKEFCAVAAADDLLTYPAHEPSATQSPPFYRLATIDVIIPSRQEVEDLWEAVQARVDCLLTSLCRKERLSVAESVRIGDPLAVDESESLSASLSTSI